MLDFKTHAMDFAYNYLAFGLQFWCFFKHRLVQLSTDFEAFGNFAGRFNQDVDIGLTVLHVVIQRVEFFEEPVCFGKDIFAYWCDHMVVYWSLLADFIS